MKSFEGYDFSQVAFPDGYGVDDLKSLSFVEAAQDFVFHGQTGRGKTHLAIAVGHACVMAGKAVRFYTAAELALALSKARRELALEAMMRDIAKNDLVILDEFGYVPLDTESARLLFQVVSSCYESRSMIFTTNIEFSKWGTVLGDDKLASAMIDRIVHHGRLVEFNGASHRMDAALMLGRAKNSEGRVCQSAQMQRAALLTFCLPQTTRSPPRYMRRRPVSPSCSGPRLSTTSPGRRRNIGDGRREVRARELRGGAGWSPGKALGLPRPCQKAAIRSSSANPKPHLRRTGGPADLARPHGRPRRTRRQARERGIIAGKLGVSAKVAES